MQKRLWYGIAWPSAVLVLASGTYLFVDGSYWQFSWMHLKLGFVACLFLYHLVCGRIYRQLSRGTIRYSSFQLRMWNELATLFLVAIVFIIVLRSSLNWVWGVVGLLLFAVALMLAIRMYRKIRQQKETSGSEEQEG